MAAITNARNRTRQRPKWVRRTKQVIAFGTIIFLACFAALFLIFLGAYRKAEDSMSSLDDRVSQFMVPPSVIVDRNGVVLYRVSSQNRRVVHLSEVPEFVRNAMIAAEDRRFYSHSGVDPVGLARAAFTVAREGRLAQGGSTITMQLAKRLYNGSDKSLPRKVRDIATACAIENHLTKDQILEIYLNQVFFGENAYGIGAASEVYFNKPVEKLTLGEAAMLARCVRSPSRENPIRDIKAAVANRDIVLGIMLDEAMITKPQYDKAIAEKPHINPHPPQTTASYPAGSARYFVHHVLDVLHDEFPTLDLKQGGYRIQTTLDINLQRTAENVVRTVVAQHRADRVTTGAFVCVDKDGKILCEVGGVDFNRNQYNMIENGHRQPGSSFKPFVYGTALATGAVRFGQMISNEPIHTVDNIGRTWDPRNSGGHYGGYLPMETAFKLSVNIPAIHVMEAVGPKTVVSYAHDSFGFKSELAPYLPLAIGSSAVNPLEMAEGYSVFMLRGNRIHPYPISQIQGPDGEIIKSYQPQIYYNVFDPTAAGEIDQLMRDVVESGTGTRARDVPNARGKTGTTNSALDAWFCGYTDGLIGIGWIANEHMEKHGVAKYEPMQRGVFGGTVTVLIWEGIMKVAHEHFATTVSVPAVAEASPPQRPRPTVDDSRGPAPDVPVVPQDDGPRPEDQKPVNIPPSSPRDNPPADTNNPVPDGLYPAPNDKPQGQARRAPARPRDDSADTIQVEVCADTGLRATPYCPETVVKTFRRGTEPKQRCRLHGPGG